MGTLFFGEGITCGDLIFRWYVGTSVFYISYRVICVCFSCFNGSRTANGKYVHLAIPKTLGGGLENSINEKRD